jgi:type III secretion system OrgA/MxiK family protein
MLRAEVLHAILHQPLDYLHPDRATFPPMFRTREAQVALNQALLRSLGARPDLQKIECNPWINLWVTNWHRLPTVARLIGAQLSWFQLARGARIRELDAFTRSFAHINLGERLPFMVNEDHRVELTISALGLGVLVSWQSRIPEVLIERLLLQFSPQVVELQRTFPAQKPYPSLLILAIQHARIHQIPY